jgi:hypothetical protein
MELCARLYEYEWDEWRETTTTRRLTDCIVWLGSGWDELSQTLSLISCFLSLVCDPALLCVFVHVGRRARHWRGYTEYK